MTLRERMARDARAMARADHTGELVTYRPKTGATRTFLAVVHRQNLEQLGGELRGAVRAADVFLPYSSSPGFGVAAIVDGDELDVVLVLGAPAVRCRIVETIAEDEGGFLVRVQQ